MITIDPLKLEAALNRNCLIGREELTLNVGLEHDGRAPVLRYRRDQVAA